MMRRRNPFESADDSLSNMSLSMTSTPLQNRLYLLPGHNLYVGFVGKWIFRYKSKVCTNVKA